MTRSKLPFGVVAALFLAGSIACSSASPHNNSETGGSSGEEDTGGSKGSTGGKSGTGGKTGTGGASATGGASGDTGGAGGATGGAGGATGGAGGGGSMTMSFFVTSVGNAKGGDFRANPTDMDGLAGADALCKQLATAVSADLGMKTWHAYLSTSTVNARDRIGKGPWRNSKGVIVANNVDQLHDQGMNGMLNATWPIGDGSLPVVLDEKGQQVPTGGAAGQRHDILTGSTMTGMVDGTNTCGNWTSMTGMAANGHSNRSGGGRPPSWNAAHTVGCGPPPANNGNFVGGTVTSGGGRGSIYCFAVE